MVQNPPEGCQRIIPYLIYRDGEAAIEFLTKAFGFTERFRMSGDDGQVAHAELSLGSDTLMIASVHPGMDHLSPKDQEGRSASVMVYVDDVDEHYRRAAEAGALVTSQPEDKFYGDRMYRAEDPEGHEWFFATHVRDVSPEEMARAQEES